MKKNKNNFDKKALAAHKKFGGKVGLALKARLKTQDDWSTYYTPGVAAVSRYVAENPKSAREYTIKKNSVAVVSNGTAVLGLGDIGPYGALPVMEGKGVIFKELADIDAFPIVLDTKDPDEVIKTVEYIAPTFGGINLEDIKAPECFYIEDVLKEKLDIPVMHDDQHGTAVVALAGLINAYKITKRSFKNSWVVISGAGAAGVAVARLLKYHASDVNILMLDSRGVIWKGRKDIAPYKKDLIKEKIIFAEEGGDLKKAIVEADIFIGVSKPNVLTKTMIRSMNPDPIVFALSNPNPEVMPDVARDAGAAVVATGRSDFPNQVNNALAFPGIFRGALDAGTTRITRDMKLAAAKALARLVKKPTTNKIIPSVLDKKVTPAVARAVRKQ